MSRNRGFTSLDECVNPIYYKAWGSIVTVQKVIKSSFDVIEQKLYRRIATYGYVNLIIPNLKANMEILKYIYSLCMQLVSPHIKIMVGNEKWNKQDIVLDFVPFTLKKTSKYSIPIGWNDNEEDYTWQDVIENGQYYSSSSTDIWPPLEYRIKATQEKIAQIQHQTATTNGALIV